MFSPRVARWAKLARSYCDLPRKPSVSDLLKNATDYSITDGKDEWRCGAYHVDERTKEKLQKEIQEKSEIIDPATTSVILFPGQGCQYVGMTYQLTDVPGVKDMFDYASSIVNFDLLKLCAEGPRDELNKTINCQIALLVTSLAALEKLKHKNASAVERCKTTAGFSVGEFSSLVFGGVLSFEEAVQLVKIRGEAMQACSETRPSGMMTVFLKAGDTLRSGMELAREWCNEQYGLDAVCQVSNHLFPFCKVVGGDVQALEFLQRNGKDFGIKRANTVCVSGAFHTSLMKPAEKILKEAFSQVTIHKPTMQVISNYDALPLTTPESTAVKLARQISTPVNWEQMMQKIYKRDASVTFPNTYEVGPKRTLTSMLKNINKKASQKAYFTDMYS